MSGITTSVSQTQPFGLGGGQTGTGNKATATHGTTKATGTGSAGGDGSSGGSTTGGSSSGDSSSGDGNGQTSESPKSNTAVIAGAVVGVVAGLGLLGLAAFFVWRHARKSQNRPPGSSEFQQLDNLGPGGGHGNNNNSISTNHGGGPNGPGELAGTAIGEGPAMLSAENAHGPYGASVKPPLPPPSPSLSVSKYNAMGVVSPQSPPPHSISPASAQHQGYGYPYGAPPPQAELPGQMYSPNGVAYSPSGTAPSYSELQGQQTYPTQQQHSPPPQAELYGGQVYAGQSYGAPPQCQPIYQADSTPIESPNQTTPSPGGMTYHSGPVPQSYSELDGSSHAR